MQDQKLQDYFEFDEDDLQANRNGNLSEKQKKELSSDKSFTIQRRRRAAAIFLALGIFLWLILAGLLIFKGTGYLAQNARSSSTVQENYLLKKVEGPVNIIQAEREIAGNASRHHFVHELHLGGVTFDVLPDLPNIMMQGDVYAAYYTEPNDDSGGRVWSVELVSKAK
jgi:hypothetical protein